MNITELRLVEKVNLNIYVKIDFLHYPNRNHPGRIVHSLNDLKKNKNIKMEISLILLEQP